MGNDNSILIVVLAVVAYFMLMPAKTLAAIEHKITKGTFGTGTIPCTRGDLYRSDTAVCDVGYEATTWFGLTDCKCISGIYTDIPNAANSPQTPAPKPDPAIDYCPYDVNILAGDSRCVPERVYNYVPRIPECPEGTYPTWYGGCEAGGGHL